MQVSRLAGFLAVILLVLGGVGIASGSYMVATDECKSGTALSIEPLEDTTGAAESDVTAFGSLSSVEQRIFLEAVTDEHDTSRTYQNWSGEWFKTAEVVTYRGTSYEVRMLHADCGVSTGVYVKFGGMASSGVGIVGLGIVAVWRLSQRS